MEDSTLQRLAQRTETRYWVAVLVTLCLLSQSILAYLVTPMTVTHDTASGKVTIVLCTLQGTRSVTVDMPEFAADAADICPALELNHVAGSANLMAPPPVLSPIAVTQPLPLAQPAAAHRSLHYAAFTSRGPPVLA